MDGDRGRTHVESQAVSWSDARRDDWMDARKQGLARSERCHSMQEVIVNLRQRLEER